MSRIVIVILIYHRHKPVEFKISSFHLETESIAEIKQADMP
jgi:hypothetical protein